MNTITNCPVCGGLLDDVALEAFVIRCAYCGASFVSAGGALGLTRTTAISDPNLSRDIIEKAISVCREHLSRYNGLLHTSIAELNLPVEHYLIKPEMPELHNVESVDSLFTIIVKGACLAPVSTILVFPLLWALLTYCYSRVSENTFNIIYSFLLLHKNDITAFGGICELLNLYFVSLVLSTPLTSAIYYHKRSTVIKRNGDKPNLNNDIMSAYKNKLAKAYEAARVAKDAKDHQLKRTIVDIESRIKMAAAEETEFINKLKSMV